jgi:hypothetical protein
VSQPRNVTPGHEDETSRPGLFPESGPGGQQNGLPPEWRMWSWTSDRERSVPWLGLLLVMVGAGLLIEYFVPALSATTIVLGAITIALFAAWLMGGVRFAIVPAVLIGALVVARLIVELNIYSGPGTTSLALAVAFLLIWLIGLTTQPRRLSNWPLWGVAIFGLIAVASFVGRIVAVPELDGLWPALIIVVGLILVLGKGRGRAPRRPPPA